MERDSRFPATPGLKAVTAQVSRNYDNANKRQRKQAERKRLAAAAPAMLAALQTSCDIMEEAACFADDDLAAMLRLVIHDNRAAIAAATGGATAETSEALLRLGIAAPLMDDELREAIHDEPRASDPAWFLDEYQRRHLARYGQKFSTD